MTTVQILLSIHILSALVAVGATVSYFFWLRRAVLAPESRSFTLDTIRMMERRMVMPAYVLVLLTGLGLIDRAGWAWSTPWLELSLLFFIVLLGLVGFHARVIKGQIALVADGSADSAEYDRAHARGRILLALKVVVIIAMVYLMVFKPALWG
ncbi:MAG: DUF2269 family protein [Dehalococcoidia bacterium]|nr:DUF2269 family protein [Dehalococcoidia bacterium]